MINNILFNKVKKSYEEYGTIILGVDFDNTIFPLEESEEITDRCNEVLQTIIDLRKKFKKNIAICLYSIGDEASIKYKCEIMKLRKIAPDYVNSSPLDSKFNCRKPYFDILLDDKSGLNETLEVTKQLLVEL